MYINEVSHLPARLYPPSISHLATDVENILFIPCILVNSVWSHTCLQKWNIKWQKIKNSEALLTPFKLSLAIGMQVSYRSCFPPEETCAFTKNVVNCSVFFHIPKLPDGFEFFPCLFNRVSPENYESMKLKKYRESSAAKPFSAGALMALRGLPGPDPDQLHQDPVSAPGAVRPCPSEAAAGLVPIPRELPDAWGCPTPGQGGGTGTAWGHCAAPEVRASESHLPVPLPDIHK